MHSHAYRIAILAVLLLARLSYSAEPAAAEKHSLPKVVLVGDSIRMAYAPLVAAQLKGRATVISSGKNGNDSANVLKLLDEFVIAHKPQIVHINCGLHDLKFDKATKQHQVPLADYEKNLREIVARIQKETDATILFALTTPIHDANHAKRGGTFDRFEADVAKYNEVAKRVMDELKIPLTDLHAVVERGGLEKLQTPDGTHYAEAGKKVQAAAVVEAIEKKLLPAASKQTPQSTADKTKHASEK